MLVDSDAGRRGWSRRRGLTRGVGDAAGSGCLGGPDTDWIVG